MLSRTLFIAVAPQCPARLIEPLMKGLEIAFEAAEINTRLRVAAFMAQASHETAGFKFMEEIWGPTAQQLKYDVASGSTLSRTLGNTGRGDGYRFRGRGIFMLTGRANYRTYGRLLGLDLENRPALAAQPDIAARVAAAYWTSRNLNRLADAGDVEGVTRGINGGLNGLEDRQRLYRLALAALPEHSPVFMRDMAGKNIEWDGKPTIYNGTRLSRYPDGALQLERPDT